MSSHIEMPDGQKILAGLIAHPSIADPFSLLVVPVMIFQDAVRAYNSKAYVGTSLICRAVLEAAFFQILTTTKIGTAPGTWRIDFPRRLDGSFRRASWPELVAAMGQRGILNEAELSEAKRVRKNGNLIAHVASMTLERVLAANKGDVTQATWVMPWEAGEDLRDTADILKRLADAAMAGVAPATDEERGPAETA
jgi:hypothetical protein